ncbi:MAG: hypothetical protein Q4C67_09365 [Deinococcus sp.]|nr:hypothetical protein [Deinococcus sp.]
MRYEELLFNGQNAFPTMQLAVGTEVGDAVTITGQAEVGRGVDGQILVGKVLTKEADGMGAVAIWGAGFTDFATVGVLTAGVQPLVVDGTGKVKVGASGRQVLVVVARDGEAAIQL